MNEQCNCNPCTCGPNCQCGQNGGGQTGGSATACAQSCPCTSAQAAD